MLKRKWLTIIERRDEGDGKGREAFQLLVSDFLSTHNVVDSKFQRNVFYSLAGSDETMGAEKTKRLIQEFVAFLVWEAE